MIPEAEQRTALSWRRTTLSVTIVGLLAARLAVLNLSPSGAAVFISMVALTWFAFLAGAQHRIRRLSSGGPPARSVPLAAGLILVYGVLGAILVVRLA